MSSGFGFPKYPQTPSPDPRQVGQQLGQGGGVPAVSPMGLETPEGDDAPPPPSLLGPAGRTLYEMAARHTGGIGQTGTGSAPPGQPDYPVDEETHHTEMNAAVGAALTRMANGTMRPADMTAARAARRRKDLERLGVTPFEIELLGRSGGI